MPEDDKPESPGRLPLIEVLDLVASFGSGAAARQVLHGVSFRIGEGESVGVVGESGSGKSVAARAILRIAPEGSPIRWGGRIMFRGQNLLAMQEREMSALRGRRIAMVFQDPMSSLNPVMTVGAQIEDALRRHQALGRAAARRRAVELLDLVGIREPAQRASDHPHHFSGGMRQRVMIAIAISCQPDLLIADEPTTALDVTVQAQVLRLLKRLRREFGMALMLITHDFGVIAGMVDRVHVMHGGRIVEEGPTDAIFARPRHAYTRELLAAVPKIEPEAAGP